MAQGKLVESTNALATRDFFEKHCPIEILEGIVQNHSIDWIRVIGRECLGAAEAIKSTPEDPDSLDSKNYIEHCLKLVQQTSAEDYEKSGVGWSLAKKRREMKLPDLKYICLSEYGQPGELSTTIRVIGFISFMITYEDGHEVVYIYEIHFAPDWQGKGLGRKLMETVEAVGKSVGVEKVMLTVFRSNARAVRWYEKLGYVEDEFSPEARTMRNGVVKEPTYTILSKKLSS